MPSLPSVAAVHTPLRRVDLAVVVALLAVVLMACPAAASTSPGPPALVHTARGPAAAIAVSDADWLWPVEGPRIVLRAFEAPPTPYASGHRGIDLAAAPGAVVRAPAAGVVAFAGRVVDRPVLAIDHDGGLRSSYEAVEATVSVGDAVAAGDPIGVLVDGPHCASGCLHVGVRLDGEYVNPMALFGDVPRAVLLPMG